jgi:hypothetical protein
LPKELPVSLEENDLKINEVYMSTLESSAAARLREQMHTAERKPKQTQQETGLR